MTDTNELRAAAERLQHRGTPDGKWEASEEDLFQAVDDGKLLAEAYLAEVEMDCTAMTPYERAYDVLNRVSQPGWGDEITLAVADAIQQAILDEQEKLRKLVQCLNDLVSSGELSTKHVMLIDNVIADTVGSDKS